MSEKSTAVQTALEPKSLSMVQPETLLERISRIHDDIARRAYEIFEIDGGLWGNDLNNWFKAEAELLHPAHITITEENQAVNVQAEVPGFNVNELALSLDPQR